MDLLPTYEASGTATRDLPVVISQAGPLLLITTPTGTKLYILAYGKYAMSVEHMGYHPVCIDTSTVMNTPPSVNYCVSFIWLCNII